MSKIALINRTAQDLARMLAAEENRAGIKLGSTVKDLRFHRGDASTGPPTRSELFMALQAVKTGNPPSVVAATLDPRTHAQLNKATSALRTARSMPTPATLRRAEIEAKSTFKSLAAQRAEAREAARNAKPQTPNLDRFNGLSGSSACKFYRDNRASIAAETNDLAVWQQRQSAK